MVLSLAIVTRSGWCSPLIIHDALVLTKVLSSATEMLFLYLFDIKRFENWTMQCVPVAGGGQRPHAELHPRHHHQQHRQPLLPQHLQVSQSTNIQNMYHKYFKYSDAIQSMSKLIFFGLNPSNFHWKDSYAPANLILIVLKQPWQHSIGQQRKGILFFDHKIF